MNGSIYVENSKNSKLGNMDAIYSSIQNTCPSSCALKNEGCYAKLSYTGMVSKRLDNESKGFSALEVAKAEAKAIDNSYSGKEVPAETILRLHVSGDSRTVYGTRLINKAIGRWKARNGKTAYSYTHAWKSVPRNVWSHVSVLASVDSITQVKEANEKGYAPALVVSEHPTDKVYSIPGSDVKWIPCPNQTRNVKCESCKLCFDADRLYEGNFGIAFAAHGVKQNQIKKRLNVIK